jgi:hypothetical protein
METRQCLSSDIWGSFGDLIPSFYNIFTNKLSFLNDACFGYDSLGKKMLITQDANDITRYIQENNEIKSKELDLLKGEDTVYKLVGPVLLKQDLVEALQTVDKRIDYIQGEM